jgi:hypothetical protein
MESYTRRGARSILILVPLIAMAAACGGADQPLIGGEQIPADEGMLAVAYDSGTDELVFELEPVDLPADAGHDGVRQPEPREGTVPVNGWVHGYRVELVDKNGQPVPQAVVHHVNIIIPGRRELFSPIMQRLGAVGHETAPVNLPSVIGYPLSQGDKVLLSAMLHNPTGQAWEGVRVRVRMPHVNRDRLVRPMRVYPFYLDVMPPAGIHEYDLPAGKSETAWEGRPAVSGRILGVGGHVHKYATSLRLEDVAAQQVIYEAKPILDAEGNVVGMPQDYLIWKLGLQIHSDRTYRLVVSYDNPTGAEIPGGGMGALGGIMVPDGDAQWPAIDPRDPDYMKDVAITMRQDEASRADAAGRAHQPDAAPHSHH